MTTWVALLRGVNVGGITIRSADLGALFRDLGFDGVRTVLASGNVRFEADAEASARAELKTRIEAGLRERFGYEAWIVLVTLDELQQAIDDFPFDATDAARQPYVVFTSDDAVRDELVAAITDLDLGIDPARAGIAVVYWHPAKGSSTDTPYAKLLAKARFAASTTTRNLRTLAKITG
ncbi:MAG: DUF1697 domain-containing protein [Microbacterium sp.]|uniref:DUF1697 domain-containing protein n=1 Tax=Microbacterium sp. TaxID=51671 RepID=UPI001ACDE9DC|nr:DUF1697 domain-containing protein [Microbacterium sp.]MBN9177221.1 DUF1697 domain-containing protein [Microbacterium sp.]